MRVRLRFTKFGRVRFLGHRDVARVWERAIRKAELPIAYSEGFSPRPRVHFGLALSVGHESFAEYLDIDLRDEATDSLDIAGLPALLTAGLPQGIEVVGAMLVAFNEPSLQATVDLVSWQFIVEDDETTVRNAVSALMARDEVPISVTRKGSQQVVDLRPALVNLQVGTSSDREPASNESTPEGVVVHCDVATKPRSFRPAEVLATFDPPLRERRIRRIEQWIIEGDERRQPVPLAPSEPPELALRAG
jgi:radical SAM-linked protein